MSSSTASSSSSVVCPAYPAGRLYPPQGTRSPPDTHLTVVEALTRHHAPHGSIHIDMNTMDMVRAARYATAVAMGHGRSSEPIMKDLTDAWASSWSNQASVIRQCTSDMSRATTGEFTFDHARNVVFPLSIRSGLDAFFRLKKFAPGSVILFSAITIPDMTVVARENNLIPVPVDVDLNTLMIKPDILEGLLARFGVAGGVAGTEGTEHPVVAVMVAHVYGRRTYLDSALDVCAKYNVPLIEDVAETFMGLDYTGDPRAEFSFFSFGSMKTATALGGAICRVRDQKLFQEMKAMFDADPEQTNRTFIEKIAKTFPVQTAMNARGLATPLLAVPLYRALHVTNFDYITWAVSRLRGFPGPDMMTRLRQRPCPALLETLLYRLRSLKSSHYRLNTVTGMHFEGLMNRLNIDVQLIAPNADCRNFWLYPVLVRDASYAAPALRKNGVDVYQGATQLSAIRIPAEFVNVKSKDGSPLVPVPYNAINLMAHVIYLPVHKLVPRETMKFMAETMLTILGSAPSNPKQKIVLLDAYAKIPASM